MQYALVTLRVIDGEREHNPTFLMQAQVGYDLGECANNIAESWYDDVGEPYSYGGFYHCGGEVIVGVNKIAPLTEAEYLVMKPYLTTLS